MSSDLKVAWISTRRGTTAADAISGNVLNRHLLHDVMSKVTAPYHELSAAHVAVLEVPPSVAPLYEHKLLDMVSRVRAAGPEVAIIVQPSMRRRSDKSLWVHKWNHLQHAPFRFFRTCSCQLGNVVDGCHFATYIGATWRLPFGPCAELPTLAATSAASLQSLGGTLSAIAHIAPLSRSCGSASSGSLLPMAATVLPPAACSGAKQTPDSAVPVPPGGGQCADSRVRTASEKQTFYPTDAKVREKERRAKLKEQGIEHVVKKRKKIMEDHYDDCGDDLSSLQDKTDLEHAGIVNLKPCDYDSEDELQYDENNKLLKYTLKDNLMVYPIDLTKIARAHPKDDQFRVGPDRRAPYNMQEAVLQDARGQAPGSTIGSTRVR